MSSEDDWIRHGIPLADPNGLYKWREQAEAQEQQFARERRIEARVQRRTALESELRAEIESLRGELAGLRAEMERRGEVTIEAVGQSLGELSNELIEEVKTFVRGVETAIWTALERRSAELSARFDLLSKPPAKNFKFAGEESADSDPIDLPNPLRRSRTIIN